MFDTHAAYMCTQTRTCRCTQEPAPPSRQHGQSTQIDVDTTPAVRSKIQPFEI